MGIGLLGTPLMRKRCEVTEVLLVGKFGGRSEVTETSCSHTPVSKFPAGGSEE
jgi:hypothetical protein